MEIRGDEDDEAQILFTICHVFMCLTISITICQLDLGEWGVEGQAREFGSDTSYTGRGKWDIWRAMAERELKGKKVVTDLHVRKSWQHREGCSGESLEDRHRDIN